jgi:hypothetical protein
VLPALPADPLARETAQPSPAAADTGGVTLLAAIGLAFLGGLVLN